MTQKMPWFRILLEGVVIVASILLAFGIDTWWEARSEDEALGALVELLQADIAADLEEMESVNARADSIAASLRELAPLGFSEVELPAPDSLHALIGHVFSAASFRPSLSVLDGAGGTAAWEAIPEDVSVLLSEYAEGFRAYDIELDMRSLDALVVLAGEFGGFGALGGFGPWGNDHERQAAFVRDPRVQTRVVLRMGLVTSEREWRAEWIEKLSEATATLSAFAELR